jgi:hypothetical protein
VSNEDILTKIEAGMAATIAAITKGNGYFNDWGTINEPDTARQTFPSAEIMIDTEECLDEDGGVWSQAYEQKCTYMIRVRTSLNNEENTPAYEINRELNKALSDLKRAFGRDYTASDSCDTVMYVGMNRITDRNNDIFRPAYMETKWTVRYTQNRLEPTINAE